LIAGLGPGSSKADYEAAGVPFSERWRRLDAAIEQARVLLRGDRLLPAPVRAEGVPLRTELERLGKASAGFPHAVVTMWTWITNRRGDADRITAEVISPMVGREPADLNGRICVGSAASCADLLSRYAQAGCRRVHFWPVGDEPR
jgi:alkanesulfonate monooxygenase SsuD/methylene tetrahydromethanopterin reductase-like flavin-dependent oxidoreductase (luciferase family)